MASKRQLEANRANARRSTGPKSPEGKARARMNAVRHGLTAKTVVISDQETEQLEALRADIAAQFQPSSALALELTNHLAETLLRLRRIPVLEAALVKAYQAEARAAARQQQEDEFSDSLEEEAKRRCDDAFGNDEEAILHAKMSGSYTAHFLEIRDQVEAEATERGDSISNVELSAEDLDQARETGLVRIVTDVENGNALAKLSRHEAGLMNTIYRTLRLLEAEQKTTKTIEM